MSPSSPPMHDTKRYISEYFPNTTSHESPKPTSSPYTTTGPYNHEGISDDIRQSLQTMGMRIRCNVSRGYKSLSAHSSFQDTHNNAVTGFPESASLPSSSSSFSQPKRSLNDRESDNELTDNDEDNMTDDDDNNNNNNNHDHMASTHSHPRRNLAPLRSSRANINRSLATGSTSASASASFTAPSLSSSYQSPCTTPAVVVSASASFTQGYTDNKAKIYYIPRAEGQVFNARRNRMLTVTPASTSSTPSLIANKTASTTTTTITTTSVSSEMDVDFDEADFLVPKEMIM